MCCIFRIPVCSGTAHRCGGCLQSIHAEIMYIDCRWKRFEPLRPPRFKRERRRISGPRYLGEHRVLYLDDKKVVNGISLRLFKASPQPLSVPSSCVKDDSPEVVSGSTTTTRENIHRRQGIKKVKAMEDLFKHIPWCFKRSSCLTVHHGQYSHWEQVRYGRRSPKGGKPAIDELERSSAKATTP